MTDGMPTSKIIALLLLATVSLPMVVLSETVVDLEVVSEKVLKEYPSRSESYEIDFVGLNGDILPRWSGCDDETVAVITIRYLHSGDTNHLYYPDEVVAFLQSLARIYGGDSVVMFSHSLSSKYFLNSPNRIYNDTVKIRRQMNPKCEPFYLFWVSDRYKRENCDCQYSEIGEMLFSEFDSMEFGRSKMDIICHDFGDSLRARGGDALLVWGGKTNVSGHVIKFETFDCLGWQPQESSQ